MDIMSDAAENEKNSSEIIEAQHPNHLDVVEEGELESIAKPPNTRAKHGSRAPSTRGQTGSRAFSTAGSQRNNFRQTWSSIAPSLEILSPDEITEQEMCDLEIEDFGDIGADLTDEDEAAEDDDPNHSYSDMYKLQKSREASSLFHMAEPNMGRGESVNGEDWEEDSDYPATRQISLLEKEAESEVDSEEENDILLEIKNEITRQVKAEMKGELALMKRQIEKESGANEKEDDLKNVDPDLKIAILKMRKLDRILAKKEKREKEVKRERILLQARLKKELSDLKPEGHDELKEVKVNTSKFLALTLPTSHNLGIRVTESGDLEEDTSPPVTPVFQTQVPDDTHRSTQSSKTDNQENGAEDASRSTSTISGSTATSNHTSASGQRKSKKKNKDFIKRNIQLAAEAGDTVAMTDDEKKRISDLLSDIDNIPEVIIDDASIFGDNPYQITLSTGEGFHPSREEFKRLEAIDHRLKALLPKEDYESIASTPCSLTRQTEQPSALFTRTNHILDVDQPGEIALKETKEHRDLSQRLKDVENQLNALTNTETIECLTDGRLSEQQLDHLLDDCVRSMSSYRIQDTPDDLSQRSSAVCSRQSLLENPPHLPSDVLQQLLAEAQQSELHLENGSVTPGSAVIEDQVIESHTDQQTLLSNALQEVQQHFSNDISRPSTGSTRPSTGDTLTRPSTGDTSTRPSTQDTLRPSSRDSQSSSRPFLPAIDPKGTLTSQNHSNPNNNNSLSRPNSRPKMKTVWNSLSDTESVKSSRDYKKTSESSIVVPHPPSNGNARTKNKRSNSGYLLEDIE